MERFRMKISVKSHTRKLQSGRKTSVKKYIRSSTEGLKITNFKIGQVLEVVEEVWISSGFQINNYGTMKKNTKWKIVREELGFFGFRRLRKSGKDNLDPFRRSNSFLMKKNIYNNKPLTVLQEGGWEHTIIGKIRFL